MTPYISRNPSLGDNFQLSFVFSIFVGCRQNIRQGETILILFDKFISSLMFIFTQIMWTEHVFWLLDSYQHTSANRSHVKLPKKLARIEAILSSIWCQQFANVFANCFCAVYTHQLELANTSLPTLVCCVKAALEGDRLLKTFGNETVILVYKLLVYKCKSLMRSFSDQLTAKPSS